MNLRILISQIICMGLIFVATNACAGKKEEDNYANKPLTITIPSNTLYVIAVDINNNPVVLDRNGETIPKCQFCDADLERKFGPECKYASEKGVRICPGTIGTTIKASNAIGLNKHSGSVCFSTATGGFVVGDCISTRLACSLESDPICDYCFDSNHPERLNEQKCK